MNKSEKEFYRQFSQHGSGEAKVVIAAKEVAFLFYLAFNDIYGCFPTNKSTNKYNKIRELAKKGLYHVSFDEIVSLPDITEDDCFALLKQFGVTDISGFIYLYLKNLCSLYRRRFKYEQILRNQPFPNADQIAPRSLLEYGKCKDSLLSSWLQWRKWIFDIDNRCGQETGYVFEPILASCLGGVSVSHTNSPVKRIDENGTRTNEGRQIDCYLEDAQEVYELKMRVTIAASGQGRFSEELSFPHEARESGLTPVLVVFDETDSPLLTKLKTAFLDNGGRCYIGQEAWDMLFEKAGKEMSMFIRKYIYPPIQAMNGLVDGNPRSIHLRNFGDTIIISNGCAQYRIASRINPSVD